MQVYCYTVGPMANNVYTIIEDSGPRCILVDPGLGAEELMPVLQQKGLSVEIVLNTHAHLDHVACNALYADVYGCPVALHAADLDLLHALPEQAAWFGLSIPRIVEPRVWLEDGMCIELGSEAVRIFHTPGHSPGHVCVASNDWVIVGDLVFAGGIGRTDLPGGDYRRLMESIHQRLLVLPDAMKLYPGHGPATTVGYERRTNPFLTGGNSIWR